MAESVTLGGVNYTIPDPGDQPNWATGLTPYLVAIAANVASAPAFMQPVSVTATPQTGVSGKTYLVTTSSIAITINLPAPATNMWLIVKDISGAAATRNITLHRPGSQTIDGTAADKVLSRNFGTWIICSDGTNYFVLNQFPDTGLVAADYAAGSISNVAINAAAAIAVSKLAAMSATKVVTTDASGFLTTASDPLPVARGGTGLGTSPITIALGGTNSIAALNNNRVMQSSAGAIVEAAAITASRALVSDSNGIPVASSTITTTILGYLANLFNYRRPVLQFGSITTVAIEAGIVTGTSGDVTLLFRDGELRTTNNTTYTTFNITRNAVLTGTKQSGLRSGLSEATSTWYAIYGVKSQDSTDVIAVGDTVLPLQANYATLNSNFGSNGWVYLGMIRNGDFSSATGDILNFIQAGNMTLFINTCAGNARPMNGTLVATTGGATSLTYTYSSGTGSTNIPANLSHIRWNWAAGGTANSTDVTDTGGNVYMDRRPNDGGGRIAGQVLSPATYGLKLSNTGATSVVFDIACAGFVDDALGVGTNPMF